ncbi:hypothetical protein N7478_008335 [Penicillium angulare]|uniref:uncharacterized protein n=1 Tax=Penicillium angulare TaxID=116970 RepID=UPI0025403C7A|nr:uncharacterized protein N7478_008335 [Penicillium angulare]KAJ5273210.1 hypothetical protein N7478_008335 [Penicillium angulare]
MSHKILAPTHELSEFEQHVYECTELIGKGAGDIRWDVNAEDCQLRFESASRGPPAKVSFTFTIAPSLCNTLGNLHGGCAATLVDVLSTTILLGVSQPGKFGFGGVSRNLKLTYLRPVPMGSQARMVCEIVHVGKRLALLRAEIQKVENGDVCVVGEHEKANTDPEVDQKI